MNRFACRCCHKNWIDPRLAYRVEQIELWTDALTITSACRCRKHNADEGGSETSSHLKGLAVDILCKTSRLRFLIISMAVKLGISRIGIGPNFVHLDMDIKKDQGVVWLY